MFNIILVNISHMNAQAVSCFYYALDLPMCPHWFDILNTCMSLLFKSPPMVNDNFVNDDIFQNCILKWVLVFLIYQPNIKTRENSNSVVQWNHQYFGL